MALYIKIFQKMVGVSKTFEFFVWMKGQMNCFMRWFVKGKTKTFDIDFDDYEGYKAHLLVCYGLGLNVDPYFWVMNGFATS